MRVLPLPVLGRLAVLGLATVLLSCGPSEASGPRLTIRVSPTPPTVGDARVIVQLPGDAPQVAAVTVTGRAPDGAQPTVLAAERSGPSVYAVAAFPFSKAGEWRLIAEATTAAGELLRDSATVRVVGGL